MARIEHNYDIRCGAGKKSLAKSLAEMIAIQTSHSAASSTIMSTLCMCPAEIAYYTKTLDTLIPHAAPIGSPLDVAPPFRFVQS